MASSSWLSLFVLLVGATSYCSALPLQHGVAIKHYQHRHLQAGHNDHAYLYALASTFAGPFPYVTNPVFDTLTQNRSIVSCLLVRADQRPRWNDYVQSNVSIYRRDDNTTSTEPNLPWTCPVYQHSLFDDIPIQQFNLLSLPAAQQALNYDSLTIPIPPSHWMAPHSRGSNLVWQFRRLVSNQMAVGMLVEMVEDSDEEPVVDWRQLLTDSYSIFSHWPFVRNPYWHTLARHGDFMYCPLLVEEQYNVWNVYTAAHESNVSALETNHTQACPLWQSSTTLNVDYNTDLLPYMDDNTTTTTTVWDQAWNVTTLWHKNKAVGLLLVSIRVQDSTVEPSLEVDYESDLFESMEPTEPDFESDELIISLPPSSNSQVSMEPSEVVAMESSLEPSLTPNVPQRHTIYPPVALIRPHTMHPSTIEPSSLPWQQQPTNKPSTESTLVEQEENVNELDASADNDMNSTDSSTSRNVTDPTSLENDALPPRNETIVESTSSSSSSSYSTMLWWIQM